MHYRQDNPTNITAMMTSISDSVFFVQTVSALAKILWTLSASVLRKSSYARSTSLLPSTAFCRIFLYVLTVLPFACGYLGTWWCGWSASFSQINGNLNTQTVDRCPSPLHPEFCVSRIVIWFVNDCGSRRIFDFLHFEEIGIVIYHNYIVGWFKYK